jgi:hypothetical protein
MISCNVITADTEGMFRSGNIGLGIPGSVNPIDISYSTALINEVASAVSRLSKLKPGRPGMVGRNELILIPKNESRGLIIPITVFCNWNACISIAPTTSSALGTCIPGNRGKASDGNILGSPGKLGGNVNEVENELIILAKLGRGDIGQICILGTVNRNCGGSNSYFAL